VRQDGPDLRTGLRHPSIASATFFIALVSLLAAISPVWATATEGHSLDRSFTPLLLTPVNSSPVVYLAGSITCPHSLCLRLYRTSDGGARFVAVSLPPFTFEQDYPLGSIRQIVFASSHVGYALGVSGSATTIYATFDGARTWHRSVTIRDVDVGDLTAASTSLYAVSTRCAKQANGDAGCTHYRLMHSSLSAKHWTSTPIPNGTNYPWGFLGNVAAYGNHVWLTEGAKWSILVSSMDRGRTLQTNTIAQLGSTAECLLTAMSAQVLWAQCPGGMQSTFYRSRNGGFEWAQVPAGQWNGTGGGYFDPVSRSLAFLDYGLRNGTYSLYRVTDYGGALTGVSTPTCSSIWSPVFVNQSDGLMLCGSYPSAVLERTIDGGKSWHRVTAN
jgi:photosystem II stability/assembly factor-like uncharacterized protein